MGQDLALALAVHADVQLPVNMADLMLKGLSTHMPEWDRTQHPRTDEHATEASLHDREYSTTKVVFLCLASGC